MCEVQSLSFQISGCVFCSQEGFSFLPCPPTVVPLPQSSVSAALLNFVNVPLGFEVCWPNLHLDPLQGIGFAMPAIPGDAVCALVVVTVAVINPVEVGVCAAVVPIATFPEASGQ